MALIERFPTWFFRAIRPGRSVRRPPKGQPTSWGRWSHLCRMMQSRASHFPAV